MSNQALIDLVTEYEAMLEQGTSLFLDQDAYRQLIDHYLSEEIFDRAMDVVEHAIETHRYSVEFLLRKAEILIQANQEYLALDVLAQADILAPNESEILLLRAQALTYLGDHQAAHEQLELLPDDLDLPILAESYFVRALIYEHQEDYESMYLALKSAVGYDSEMRHGLEKIMNAVQHLRNYEESVRLHEQIIDENPYSCVAWYNLGLCQAHLSNYEEALESLEFAYLADERYEQAYRERADLAFELQRYELTYDICEEIEQNFGADADLLLRMGQCQLRIGNRQIAKKMLKKALTQDQHNDEIFYHLGEIALLEKQWELAVHYCKKAIELDDNREEYHASIATAYAQLDDLEQAETHYCTATDIAPEDAQYWLQYALFLMLTSQEEGALEILDLAEETAVGSELVYCRVACLFLLGERQEALLLLSEVLEEAYEDHSLLFNMAPQLQRDVEVISLLRAYS